jgi:hypothetical protein
MPSTKIGQDLWHLKDKLQCFSHEEKRKNIIKYKTIKCHHLGQSIWLNNNKYFKIIIKLLCSCGGENWGSKTCAFILMLNNCSKLLLDFIDMAHSHIPFFRGRWRCSNSNSSELSLPLLVQWISTLVITNSLHFHFIGFVLVIDPKTKFTKFVSCCHLSPQRK